MNNGVGQGDQLIGIDVGGTFTDFVWLRDGHIEIQKIPTSTGDQSAAIIAGLAKIGIQSSASLIHGSTVATNALLEKAGARTALITTDGFADVLVIGRQNRPSLYALSQQKPAPLVQEDLRFEVEERINSNGETIKSLEEEAIRKVLEQLSGSGAESVAVVLLFSFLNPEHEHELKKRIHEVLPEVFISLSCIVLPEYREYERMATTVINAYVQPKVHHYLNRLKQQLESHNISIMQSSGGTIDLDLASEQAARLVLSGPAGGAVGALSIAERTLEGVPDLLTLDMGGTSTDVAYCPGELPRTNESTIAGLPLRFPTIDIHTVGAGGGSIARIDKGGVLRVGPQSAGALPGPVCYNRGGTEPTVTDANLVLGRIDSKMPLGGTDGLILNLEKARSAISRLGERLGYTVEQTAAGIIQIANARMERAMRRVSVERGHDPRSSTLVPFGGAGPLHACKLADALSIRRILVPRFPGVLSAMGMLMADRVVDASKSMLLAVSELQEKKDTLENEARTLKRSLELSFSEIKGTSWQYQYSLDMRYIGQSYELTVPVAGDPHALNLDDAVERFHDMHEKRFGYAALHEEVECVTLRARGVLPAETILLPELEKGPIDPSNALIGSREIWVDGDYQITSIYDRTALLQEQQIEGPALVNQYDTVILIQPGWLGDVDKLGNLILSRI